MLAIHSESRCAPAGFLPLVLILLVIGLMHGRSEAAPEVTTLTPLDACALLTNADVELVFGTKVGNAQEKQFGSGQFWVSMCNYDNAEFDAPMLSVGLLVKAHGVSEGPTQAYEAHVSELRHQLGEAAVPVPVAGTGARAGWSADVGQLTVFEGPYQLILTTNGRFAGDRLALAKQLAGRALPRLAAQ